MFWNKKRTQAVHREPRDHHYVFAHQIVRDVCTHDPLQFFAVIGSPEREKYIEWLWQMTEKRIGMPVADVAPGEMTVTTCRVKDSPTVVFKMPAPLASAEAHFIGVVLTGFPQLADSKDAATFRYFTLEHGLNLDGTIRTVMCEWVQNSHHNFGDGPVPTVEAFIEAMEKIV